MTDLTKIEKPFFLLDAETRAALKAHDGPIEWFSGEDWVTVQSPLWNRHLAYRAKPQPVRGEVVFNGSLYTYFSLHPDENYRNPDLSARVTFSTIDAKLIPGTYTGPDGATIKIEALK